VIYPSVFAGCLHGIVEEYSSSGTPSRADEELDDDAYTRVADDPTGTGLVLPLLGGSVAERTLAVGDVRDVDDAAGGRRVGS